MHKVDGLAHNPAGEVLCWDFRAYGSGFLVSGWGNLTVPLPSKEGESPSNLVLLVRIFLSKKAGQELW